MKTIEHKQFRCTHPGCDKVFNRRDYLERHATNHLSVKPYVCVECNRHFSRKDLYDNHLTTKRHARVIHEVWEHTHGGEGPIPSSQGPYLTQYNTNQIRGQPGGGGGGSGSGYSLAPPGSMPGSMSGGPMIAGSAAAGQHSFGMNSAPLSAAPPPHQLTPHSVHNGYDPRAFGDPRYAQAYDLSSLPSGSSSTSGSFSGASGLSGTGMGRSGGAMAAASASEAMAGRPQSAAAAATAPASSVSPEMFNQFPPHLGFMKSVGFNMNPSMDGMSGVRNGAPIEPHPRKAFLYDNFDLSSPWSTKSASAGAGIGRSGIGTHMAGIGSTTGSISSSSSNNIGGGGSGSTSSSISVSGSNSSNNNAGRFSAYGVSPGLSTSSGSSEYTLSSSAHDSESTLTDSPAADPMVSSSRLAAIVGERVRSDMARDPDPFPMLRNAHGDETGSDDEIGSGSDGFGGRGGSGSGGGSGSSISRVVGAGVNGNNGSSRNENRNGNGLHLVQTDLSAHSEARAAAPPAAKAAATSESKRSPADSVVSVSGDERYAWFFDDKFVTESAKLGYDRCYSLSNDQYTEAAAGLESGQQDALAATTTTTSSASSSRGGGMATRASLDSLVGVPHSIMGGSSQFRGRIAGGENNASTTSAGAGEDISGAGTGNTINNSNHKDGGTTSTNNGTKNVKNNVNSDVNDVNNANVNVNSSGIGGSNNIGMGRMTASTASSTGNGMGGSNVHVAVDSSWPLPNVVLSPERAAQVLAVLHEVPEITSIRVVEDWILAAWRGADAVKHIVHSPTFDAGHTHLALLAVLALVGMALSEDLVVSAAARRCHAAVFLYAYEALEQVPCAPSVASRRIDQNTVNTLQAFSLLLRYDRLVLLGDSNHVHNSRNISGQYVTDLFLGKVLASMPHIGEFPDAGSGNSTAVTGAYGSSFNGVGNVNGGGIGGTVAAAAVASASASTAASAAAASTGSGNAFVDAVTDSSSDSSSGGGGGAIGAGTSAASAATAAAAANRRRRPSAHRINRRARKSDGKVSTSMLLLDPQRVPPNSLSAPSQQPIWATLTSEAYMFHQGADPELQWREWVLIESCKRTAHLSLYLDSIVSLSKVKPHPVLISNMDIHMVCPDPLWKAQTANGFLSITGPSRTVANVPYLGLIKSLIRFPRAAQYQESIQSGSNPWSIFALKAVAHGLIILVGKLSGLIPYGDQMLQAVMQSRSNPSSIGGGEIFSKFDRQLQARLYRGLDVWHHYFTAAYGDVMERILRLTGSMSIPVSDAFDPPPEENEDMPQYALIIVLCHYSSFIYVHEDLPVVLQVTTNLKQWLETNKSRSLKVLLDYLYMPLYTNWIRTPEAKGMVSAASLYLAWTHAVTGQVFIGNHLFLAVMIYIAVIVVWLYDFAHVAGNGEEAGVDSEQRYSELRLDDFAFMDDAIDYIHAVYKNLAGNGPKPKKRAVTSLILLAACLLYKRKNTKPMVDMLIQLLLVTDGKHTKKELVAVIEQSQNLYDQRVAAVNEARGARRFSPPASGQTSPVQPQRNVDIDGVDALGGAGDASDAGGAAGTSDIVVSNTGVASSTSCASASADSEMSDRISGQMRDGISAAMGVDGAIPDVGEIEDSLMEEVGAIVDNAITS